MYINKDPDSAQYRIWNDRFLCQMRHIDTMSTDYLRIFGTLTTFDSTLDRQMHNEIVDRYLTIIKMVEYFNEGISIYIKNPEDSKTIYVLIQEHLQNWQKEMQIPFRTEKAPVEELLIMDRFAQSVYEHAKWYLDNALVDTPFAASLKRDTSSILSLLKEPKSDTENTESLVLESKRQSMADVFSQGATRLERRF